MSEVSSPTVPVLPAWRDPAAWMKVSDIVAVLLALSLPWSTSLVGILGVVLLITVAPTLELKSFLASLKRPISAMPIALFVLALAGTLWSDATWGARFYAVGPAAKLLVLPVLLYHFERSTRGTWVFTAFLVSCTLLMLMSWVVFLHPGLIDEAAGGRRPRHLRQELHRPEPGIHAVRGRAGLSGRRAAAGTSGSWLAVLLTAIALSFFVNMAFVVVSRTALVTVPIMFAVFALLHLRWRSIVHHPVRGGSHSPPWPGRPRRQLRRTAETFTRDYTLYKEQNIPTSIGLRLEFWRKSLAFFAEAPFIGHGTGCDARLV